MATELITEVVGMQEIRTYPADFEPDLLSGITVVSATATHTPPSGAASLATVDDSLAPLILVTLGPLSVEGWHILDIIATLSDGEISEIRLDIPVKF